MASIVSLVVLTVFARARGEPLAEALQRRSDAFSGIYANEFDGDYEAVALAAVPLHAPLPVLHVVASAPLLVPPGRARRRPPRRQPPRQPYDLLAAASHQYGRVPTPLYLQPSPAYSQALSTYAQLPQIYAASLSYPMYEAPPPDPTTEEAPTVLYARPKPQGGYTYHRRPAKKRNAPKKQEPYVLRIHKYKVKGR